VPAVTLSDLDEAKLRLLRLALNRLGEESSWDVDALRLEFSEVLEITSDIDLRISGSTETTVVSPVPKSCDMLGP
jgi:hypothetical protein